MKVLILGNDIEALGGASVAAVNYYDLLVAENIDVRIEDLNSIDRHYADRYGSFYSFFSKVFAPVFYIFNPFVFFYLRDYVVKNRITHGIVHLYVGGLSNSAMFALARLGVDVSHVVHDYRQICPANALLDAQGMRCSECRKGIYQVLVRNCKNNIFISSMVYIEALIRKNFFSPSKLKFRYIFVSAFAKKKHAEFNEEELKSRIIYNAIPEPKLAKNVRGVHASSLDYVFIGRLSEEKGIHELLNAFIGSDGQLDIYGSGPLEELAEEYATQNANIKFKGRLNRDEVLETFAKYKFSLVTSNWYENNPISIIESLSVGTPVISTGHGGLPEMIVRKDLVLPSPPDPNAWRQQLQELLLMSFDDYSALSLEAINLYRQKFSERHAREELVQVLKFEEA